MTAPDTTPSAALAAIRERYRRCGNSPDIHVNLETWIDSANDIPSLVAAVEAALALAGPEPTDPDPYPEHPMIRLVRCDVLREAITAALTGTPKEGSDE